MWIIIILYYSTPVILKNIYLFQKKEVTGHLKLLMKSFFPPQEMNVLCFFAAVILLGWFDVAGLIELMGVVKWVSGTKFCSSLLTGTSGDSWIVASCWEADDMSFEFEGTWRNSLLHGDEQSMPFWFLLANACKDSSALPKFSWCWTCWRIHLDNPSGGGEKKKCYHKTISYILFTDVK